jgi:hypothetical protein
MSIYDKTMKSVAEAASKIMSEKLHPNQQKLDVHEPEKDKLTAKDFEMLRKGKKAELKEEDAYGKDRYAVKNGKATKDNPSHMGSANYKDQPHHVWASSAEEALKKKSVKEEVKQVEEGMSHQAKTTMKHIPNASPALKQAAKDIKPGVKGYQDRVAMLKAGGVKEDVEQIEEVKMADLPSTKVQGRAYGSSKPQPSAFDVLKGPKEKELKSIESEKKKKKFNEMVEILQTKGLKGMKEAFEKEEVLAEEPDNEQFTKELEVQKRKNAGTAPESEKAKVAAPSVQAVEVQKEETHKEIQVVDLTDPDNITVETKSLEERSLTEPEMKKKEEIVKSMKKGLKGFKERYGERAKEVMYATATARAKGD